METDALTLSAADAIGALKPGQRIYLGSPRGFGVRCTKAGTSWFIRWKVAGKHHEISLGPCAETTRTKAERQAEKHRAAINAGADPLGQRRQRTAAAAARAARITLTEFSKTYQETVAKKESSKRIDETLLKHHILPLLGAVAVADLDKHHAQKLHAAQSLKKKPIMANRAHALLSHLLAEACRRGLRDAPLPRACVTKNEETKRERYLSPDEHTALWKAFTALETKKHRDGAHALKLLTLTGCRKNEIVRLAWNEVDLPAACLRLADSKTGSRTVQLSPQAVAILKARFDEKRSAWVFPSEDLENPRDNVERTWRNALKAAELDGVRIHDLRHSLAATGVAAGLSLPQIGRLLGHKSSATTARYAHVSDAVAREASDTVAAEMAKRLSRPAPKRQRHLRSVK